MSKKNKDLKSNNSANTNMNNCHENLDNNMNANNDLSHDCHKDNCSSTKHNNRGTYEKGE